MLDVPGNAELSNNFATIEDVSVDAISNRVIPRQTQSGVERGTKTFMNTDGSYMTLGLIPDGGTDFGIAFFDASGNLVMKVTSSTQYWYDVTTGKNNIQLGKLPDGSYNFAAAADGLNVADGFS